jgi:hypothetical protein
MNKKMLCIVSIVITFVGTSMALDFMGPPTASLNTGQAEIGYTFHFSENDMEVSEIKFNDVETDGKITIDDVEITRHYFTFNYGLEGQRMEFYGFLGASDMEADDILDAGVDFDGGSDFAFGIGTKITTNIYDNADWGFLVQASWLNSDDTIESVDVEIDAVEIQAAFGPTVKISDEWKIYGGGFGYWLAGDVELDDGIDKLTGELDDNATMGGYIGTQIEIIKNTALSVEYALTDDGFGIGGNFSWRF